jgi:hypothetical protein
VNQPGTHSPLRLALQNTCQFQMVQSSPYDPLLFPKHVSEASGGETKEVCDAPDRDVKWDGGVGASLASSLASSRRNRASERERISFRHHCSRCECDGSLGTLSPLNAMASGMLIPNRSGVERTSFRSHISSTRCSQSMMSFLAGGLVSRSARQGGGTARVRVVSFLRSGKHEPSNAGIPSELNF